MNRDFWAKVMDQAYIFSFTFSQTTLKQQNDFLQAYIHKDKENWRQDDQNNRTLGRKTGRPLVTALGDQRKCNPKPKVKKAKMQLDLYVKCTTPGNTLLEDIKVGLKNRKIG